MWMPLTPPSSNNWQLSPELQSNIWINASPTPSSSPLSTLFPPLVQSPRVEWSTDNENVNNNWQRINVEANM